MLKLHVERWGLGDRATRLDALSAYRLGLLPLRSGNLSRTSVHIVGSKAHSNSSARSGGLLSGDTFFDMIVRESPSPASTSHSYLISKPNADQLIDRRVSTEPPMAPTVTPRSTCRFSKRSQTSREVLQSTKVPLALSTPAPLQCEGSVRLWR